MERARAAGSHEELEDASIASLQHYQTRIQSLDRKGPSVNSVLELNPDAEAIARSLD